MSSHNYHEILDQLDDTDDIANLLSIRNMPHRKGHRFQKQRSTPKGKNIQAEARVELSDQSDGKDSFQFSYNASRHERVWIVNSLGNFYEQHWIDDVLRLVKGGKEASVYLCAGNATTQAEYIAAKVYRPRKFRNLKNDHLYREGRTRLDADGHEITDGGMLHAMNKRTAYGLELAHASWIEHEYQALVLLFAAGADVPAPYGRGDNAILMRYVGGPQMPAPALNDVDLDPGEAQTLFDRVVRNIRIMLSQQRVHGDLSAYNILYWEGEITLIDFPQTIDPRQNRNSYTIFERDVTRVCEYFARQGVSADPRKLASDLWTAYRYPTRPEVHPSLLDAEDEQDRAYWENLKKDL